MVWYLWQGWYYFVIHTPNQFPLRFIIIVNRYTGTAVLVCMTACDIATFVCVAHELLCCHIELAEVPTAYWCYCLSCYLGCGC